MGRGLISEDVINQIRDRTDIVEVVSQHVSLTRSGQNLKGLCPFHQEKSPSFTVSPSRQIFHCFGCGAGGNVFTFLTRITGASFPETVRDLGRRVGIEVQEPTADSGSQTQQVHRTEHVSQAAARWFQENLRNDRVGAEARVYLAGREIHQTMIDQFGIGAAPADWDGLLKAMMKQGFSAPDLAAAGLVI